jgi:hypothetical protein
MALTIKGVDYAWGTPPYDALKQNGYRFAMRYVSHDPGKDLKELEKRELHRRGIATGLVFESTSGRALSGNAAGREDAKFAAARATSLGLSGIPIYFAVDFDATDAQKPAIANYLKGCASVLGKDHVGVYGGYHVVKYMHDHGVCDWLWQTYAWSGGLVHPATHIFQWKNGVRIGGLSCDLNKASAEGLRSLRGASDPHAAARRKRIRHWRGEVTQRKGAIARLRGQIQKLRAKIKKARAR